MSASNVCFQDEKSKTSIYQTTVYHGGHHLIWTISATIMTMFRMICMILYCMQTNNINNLHWLLRQTTIPRVARRTYVYISTNIPRYIFRLFKNYIHLKLSAAHLYALNVLQGVPTRRTPYFWVKTFDWII